MGHASHLRCNRCSADLCLTSQIISKGFTGRHGRAYLVQGQASRVSLHSHSSTLPNTYQNKAVPRELVTGQHTVSDISCSVCGSVLGWKYVEAQEERQRYKVGKFILETKRIRGSVSWENGDDDVDWGEHELPLNQIASAKDDAVEFDSEDEDECEDLFAGVWSPELALKRRRGRRFGRGNGVGGGAGGRARSEDVR
jgi:Yippee zinc-binding/DNA-binding /Mis18, centromere assembly